MSRMMLDGMHDEQVLQALNTYWKTHCTPPTVRVLMRMARVSSTSMVTYVLEKLEEKGEILMRDRKPVPRWVVERLNPVLWQQEYRKRIFGE